MPKVSIIITAFHERSKNYLDLLIKSIYNLDYANKEIILVSPLSYAPTYDGVKTVSPDWAIDLGNDAALNYGASRASADCDYYFFLNDDVILTKNCLKNLVKSSRNCQDDCLLMPMSNDQMNRYALLCHIPHGPYRYEQIKDVALRMMDLDSVYPNGILFHPTLCLYAAFIPKKVYTAVGEFDENYKTGQSDIDYTLRVLNAGFMNGVVLDALLFHAGGATSEWSLTQNMRTKNDEYHAEKWKGKI